MASGKRVATGLGHAVAVIVSSQGRAEQSDSSPLPGAKTAGEIVDAIAKLARKILKGGTTFDGSKLVGGRGSVMSKSGRRRGMLWTCSQA